MVLISLHFRAPHTAAQQHPSKIARSTADEQQALATMDSQINSVITNNASIDISATLIDIHSGNVRSYGPAVPYEAASVAKLITAADYLHEVEAGNQSLQSTLEDDNTASVDLQSMVVQSDNDAWQSLNNQLGLDSLATYSTSIGITDYNLSANTLTTSDIAGLLQKLYLGQLLNKPDTALLLNYMKQANEADFIPPVVPSGVTVYHKAGLLDDRVHDATIIDNGQTPIVLVVFTNGHGTYDFPARTTIIQSIANAAMVGYNIK